MIFLSILVLILLVVMIALAIGGDALVWVLPTYGQFRRLVREIELASVSSVKATTTANLTLGQVSGRRVPEIFDTPLQRVQELSIRNCFAAIYLKDELLEEIVSTVRVNAGIVVIAAILGGLWIALEPETVVKLKAADTVSFIYIFAQILLESHLVLFAELAVIAVYVIFLFHNRILLLKLLKQMGS